ncbi:ABC transporter substrate-binding protein [Flavobacterium silvaticum]|uniref:ABC transporter substrate-binding protein n=1 Tax=Flavobacterium silvaticum TaxID=1852020 RepID=A0A972FST5_9FLAO|nr:helical backbone metal receptor [Flavobacterium silvaticum]NMH27818.1 ABC transporter substrate-binding protein [Flavobacterium silvaticum]
MPITFTDQLGTLHSFEQNPKRIVSLVPSQTELLYDLGLEENIVGITKFCVHPYHFKSTKKIIGGTKKVHIEKIRLLEPDIIIANKEENTEEIVNSLSEICPVWVTDVRDIAMNSQMISDFGELFNCRTESKKILDKLTFTLADFNRFMTGKPWRKSAYFIWKDPYMAAGGDNFINEMMRLNHFTNIYEDRGRYPEVIVPKLRIQGDPELIFLSSEPYPFKDEDAFEIGRSTHHAKTIFVDGEMFSWYGSRLLKALPYFRQLQEKLA